MQKIKKKPLMAEPTEPDQSEDSIDDVEYDSMIENGTSESDDSEPESEGSAGSAKSSIHEEDNTPTKPETSRKRKQPPAVEPTLEKMQKIRENKKLFKQPTVEEINQLRETENLYHSNLFRMQIQEMLNEVRVKDKYKSFVTAWLDEFNAFLNTIPSMPERENSTGLSFLKKCQVQVPFNLNRFHSKDFQFQFIAPQEKVVLIGSADVDAWTGPNFTADVCVSMPARCFQKENYLNLIYDQKRALYLTFIAKMMLKKSFHSSNLKFNCVHNNPYKPVLEVVPDGKMGKRLTIRIFVAGDNESFKLNRFVPWTSNIRDSLFTGEISEGKDEIPLATPNYNATVLFDLTAKVNQKVISDVVGVHSNLREGLILLKIWLRQRNLNTGFCGYGSHLMTLLVVYLFRARKIHASMSSYQVARTVWNHLATSEWNVPDKGISLCSQYDQPNQPTVEQFHTYYEIVFVDSTGYLNLCANLSLDVYLKLKFESQRALDLLNNTKINSFQALFMTSVPIYTRFDHFLNICDEDVIENVLARFRKKADLHNFAGLWFPRIAQLIPRVLRKGLGERVLSLVPIEEQISSWPIAMYPREQTKSFKIGFVLNSEAAFEILNKGPQANEPESEEFREFWGPKSQLRRFQDGSITEACVWASASASTGEKRLIVKRIVLHLLYYHFQIFKQQFVYMANEFEKAYRLDNVFYVVKTGVCDAESTTVNVVKKFDDVAKKLRACDGLPLDITAVQGISSVFRYCDPVPILSSGKHYEEDGKIIFQSYKIGHGVIQLGLSGKWPNDLQAFRRIKTAFHIQIARCLREKFHLITRGGVDGVCILNDGYVFKVEIAHQKEVALMKKTISPKGVVQYIDTPESLEYEKRLNVLPKITSALHGLYQRYTSFGPTVMIAKRWLYSQLLDSYLWPDECTELLIASQFTKEGCCPNPVQPQSGFFRFLEFLANTDFRNELILLNFNDEMSHDEITELESKFVNDRENYPPLAIITSFDTKKDCIWSKSSPSPQILARVILLARHALKQIECSFLTEKFLMVRKLFVASKDGYDLIITLNPNLIHSCQAHYFERRFAGERVDVTVPAAEFDPVQRGLQELRDAYSDFAIFFYNPCGGRMIAVIWKPECFTQREFKVANVNGCFVDENGLVKCNVEQLIDDFKIILKGLFVKITNFRELKIKDDV